MVRISARRCSSLLLATLWIAAAGCGSDQSESLVIDCSDEEYYDQVNDTCVPRSVRPAPDAGGGGGEGAEDAGDEADVSENDAAAPDTGIDEGCDEDGDGALSMACGGADCDDTNPRRSPTLPELCDEFDNNCDGQVNEGVRCTFYAHSGTDLYEIDPFRRTSTQVGQNLPNLLDIDTHPDGTLYGITYEGLFSFDRDRVEWNQVGNFGRDVGDPNGLAIDSFGVVYATSQDEVYTIDVVSGAADLLGTLGGEYYSSGDIVVDRKDAMFVTSKHDVETDHLLLVSRADGAATNVGPIGFKKVFALTSAWGRLYGLTEQGALIEIDAESGAGSLVHAFDGIRWFGAASTPGR